MNYVKMFSMNNNCEHDSESESDSDDEKCQNEINELAQQAKLDLIPEASKRLYEVQYQKFKDWCIEVKSKKIDENLLLAYFQKLSTSYAATTLWSTYSKLKAMIRLHEGTDIKNYMQLQCFLKTKGKRHTKKKAKVFTNSEVSNFLNNATDDEYLLHKVALILGLHGCLRSKDLLNIQAENIKQEGFIYQISVFISKTKKEKTFYTDEDVYPVLQKYISLRPKSIERFLVQYRNKKCTQQVVGKGKLYSILKDIARFLNLPDVEKYTGHAYRRTSATLLVDQGADIMMLKRHGLWESNSVAESYVDESVFNKKNTSKLMSTAMGIKKQESVTKCGLLDKIVNSQSKVLTQIESNEINNISQEEYAEVLDTDFSQKEEIKSEVLLNKNINTIIETSILEKEKRKLTQLERSEIENISQEEFAEVILIFLKKMK